MASPVVDELVAGAEGAADDDAPPRIVHLTERQPVAYAVLRVAAGISKLCGAACVICFSASCATASLILVQESMLFFAIMVFSFLLLCGVMAACFLRYSLRTLMEMFLVFNALIACLFSKMVIAMLVAAAFLFAIVPVLFIELALYDPGYGCDAGSSDIAYLFQAFGKMRHGTVWLCAALGLFGLSQWLTLGAWAPYGSFWTGLGLMVFVGSAAAWKIVWANANTRAKGELGIRN